MIELARAGGFSYIMNYGGVWSTSSGKYRVNTKNFPSGLPGVKAAMDKIHAAGLKGGAHILSGCIDKDNEYVTPTPDPRLAKDDMRILAREVGPDDSTLPLTASPEGLPTIESPDFYSGKSVIIEDEIIIYDQLEKALKFALSGCTRGAYAPVARRTRPVPVSITWAAMGHVRGGRRQHTPAGDRSERGRCDQLLRF